MFRLLAVAALAGLMVFAATSVSQAQSERVSQVLEGVASVIDGDTIEIQGQRIRLAGIDAPERGAWCGAVNVHERAALTLGDLLNARPVRCQPSGRDGARIVAHCAIGGVDVGEHLVAAGWARDWPRYSGARYARAETGARQAGRGVWGLSCAADIWSGRDYAAGAAAQNIAPRSVEPAPSAIERAYVRASALNLRLGPGLEHPSVARLRAGTSVRIITRHGQWAEVETEVGRGWVSSSFLGAAPSARPALSDGAIRRALIARSLASYSGSCPCPYNVDRAGRSCGARSAYSRPGGASPLCYAHDVSDAAVSAYRAANR